MVGSVISPVVLCLSSVFCSMMLLGLMCLLLLLVFSSDMDSSFFVLGHNHMPCRCLSNPIGKLCPCVGFTEMFRDFFLLVVALVKTGYITRCNWFLDYVTAAHGATNGHGQQEISYVKFQL